MNLKEPLWTSGLKKEASTDATEAQESAETAVEELVNTLNNERLYREITLALRSSLRDARAEFSFLRHRALRSLLKFLGSVSQSDSTISLFCQTQSIPDLQGKLNLSLFFHFLLPVVPVLFQHSFKESEEDNEEDKVASLNHVFGVEPMKITSPSTDAEVALALRVLEGCCLLHRNSTVLAHRHKAIQVLMRILSTRGVMEQGACLDALISLLLDSSPNQMDFEECNGIEEVTVLIRDKQVEENLRLKCGEFLLLLIGHVNGRERAPMASIQEDVKRLLGEKAASLIWAASQFDSTLDPEQRMTNLHIQAGRVLESLDLY
ncbi:hypothetical protein Tsubulata_023721 [Turnera subulata]|uniref:Uncharacterized protein n=1 Tax=Turnera subulata TaxID=218843 RepID=A0A9Q0FPZ2_9ROSI|nr:hypothetical protein Tsubulata_023721 [Turnera subulata]